ncbi:MAG: hypothetical protein IJW63_06240 [Lachnospiraceae bacterium]|nr:hypothetical protein [Lachnospiraceae bacterium]
MAIGVIEIATIARSQDYAAMKHHETAKVVTDQGSITTQVQKDATQNTRQVREGENPTWQSKKFDAKEKGDSHYSGDGGQRRKKDDKDGSVVLKSQGGFDVKI